MSETIWYRAPGDLFSGGRAKKFFPTASMAVHSQLNAIVRFCIYYSLLMIMFTRNPRHLIIALLAGSMTFIVSEFAYTGKGETYLSGDSENAEECTTPTVDNPYMNFRAFDDRDRPRACKPWNVKDRSLVAAGEPVQDSPYQKPFDRFYTMPCTTATNDQHGFATWLYGSMPAKRTTPETPLSVTNHVRDVR